MFQPLGRIPAGSKTDSNELQFTFCRSEFKVREGSSMVTKKLFLEVCVDSVQGAIIAEQAGADRIELCAALETGGVTPSTPLLRAVRSSTRIPLVVLVRSRPGDFFYDDADRAIMLEEIETAIDNGASAVALGGIQANRQLDWMWLETVRHRFPDSELVIHRAFDVVHDKIDTAKRLIDLGYQRILTSGGPSHAMDGLDKLRELIEFAKDRIEILPAGGVQSSNAMTIASETGCTQIHGSFRDPGLFNDAFETRLPRADWIRDVAQGG